jgi:cyclic pyranopterin phosphate synthase
MGPDRLISPSLVARRPDLIPNDYSDAHTLLVTFGFRCNLACVFCMVEDVLDVYKGADLGTFRAFLDDREAMRRIRRVTFSGGEATLEREIFDYVRLARSAPGVEHVRVQTNATRLANRTFLNDLIDAGVDEFFVSIHGPDPDICDRLTARAGSFRAIMAGIEAVAESTATLMTNTAIVEPNHRRLSDIVALVAPFRPRTMDFWNIWPRIDQDDSRGMFVRVTDARPHLWKALGACEERGILPVVKWFPHCMLGPYVRYHDDGQPTVLVEQSYWEKAPQFACIYEGVCRHAPEPCAGLSYPYIHKFGWEEDVLEPSRRAGPGNAEGARVIESRAAGATSTVSLEPWIERLGLVPSAQFGNWQLQSARAHQGALVVSLVRDGHDLRIRMFPHDPRRKCFARTRSFDVVHDSVPAPIAGQVEAPLAAFLAHVRRIDAPEAAGS